MKSIIHGPKSGYFYKYRKLFFLCCLLLSGIYNSVLANNGSDGAYFGLGFSRSYLEPDQAEVGGQLVKEEDTGLKIVAGKDFSNRLALEGFWADLGEAGLDQGGKIGYSYYGANGLLKYGGNEWKVFAKTGLAAVELDTNISTGIDEKIAVFHGVGAEWKLRNGLAVRSEYDVFSSDVKLLTFSLLKRFVNDELPSTQKSSKNLALEKSVIKEKQVSNAKKKPLPAAVKPTVHVADLDMDGVPDSHDKCSSTPKGARVNRDGCPVFVGRISAFAFSPEQSSLNANARRVLDSIAKEMAYYSNQEFVIVGNAKKGPKRKEISLKRALNASRHLVARGVNAHDLRFGVKTYSQKDSGSQSTIKPNVEQYIEIYLSQK